MALFVAGILYFLVHRDAVKKFLVWQVFQLKDKEKAVKKKKNIKINPSTEKGQSSSETTQYQSQTIEDRIETNGGYSIKIVSK